MDDDEEEPVEDAGADSLRINLSTDSLVRYGWEGTSDRLDEEPDGEMNGP